MTGMHIDSRFLGWGVFFIVLGGVPAGRLARLDRPGRGRELVAVLAAHPDRQSGSA